MATLYINWHKLDQPIRGDVLPIEGSRLGYITVNIATLTASAAAPEGVAYATIWADVNFSLTDNNSKTAAYPANTPVQVHGIKAGDTLSGVAI